MRRSVLVWTATVSCVFSIHIDAPSADSDVRLVTLPRYHHRLLRLTLEGEFPGRDEVTPVRLEYVDGCRSGEPGVVDNAVLVNGVAIQPGTLNWEFSLLGPPSCPQPDAPLQLIMQTMNVGQSGRLFAGIARPPDSFEPAVLRFVPGRAQVWVGMVSQLGERGVFFLGEKPFGCRDAADFNGDGRVDLSDAIGNIQFLFLGGLPPAPPGPPGEPCGVDPEPHTREGCAVYENC